mgnify:CR=1 FL=1
MVITQHQSQNLSISILTGLPGSIDYIVLVLYKLNIITKNTRKKMGVLINNWFRGPGCILVCSWMYSSYMLNTPNIPIVAMFINIVLTYVNGMYYNKEVMESYYKHLSQ